MEIKPEIKMVVTDLDGTLLDGNGKITPDSIEVIKLIKSSDLHFGIASGRSIKVIERMAEEYKISEYIDFIIGTNGVELSEEGILEYAEYNYLEREIILEIYNRFCEYDATFIVHDKDVIITNKENKYTEMEKYMNNYRQEVRADFKDAIIKNHPRLMIVGEPDKLREIELEMEKEDENKYHFFKSYIYFLEVVTKNISKGSMLLKYCAHKGIDPLKVMALGDNNNDLEMIKNTGYGIAMGNATEDLKKSARHITGTNNEGGFAQAVRHYILGN